MADYQALDLEVMYKSSQEQLLTLIRTLPCPWNLWTWTGITTSLLWVFRGCYCRNIECLSHRCAIWGTIVSISLMNNKWNLVTNRVFEIQGQSLKAQLMGRYFFQFTDHRIECLLLYMQTINMGLALFSMYHFNHHIWNVNLSRRLKAYRNRLHSPWLCWDQRPGPVAFPVPWRRSILCHQPGMKQHLPLNTTQHTSIYHCQKIYMNCSGWEWYQ